MIRTASLSAALLLVAVQSAVAQDTGKPYRLQSVNFDIWCQETQHLPPRRCDKRLPEDDAAYQAYQNKIENYEIEYLHRHDSGRSLQRDLTHIDPSGVPPAQPGTPGGP
jgi:hypothetical protein